MNWLFEVLIHADESLDWPSDMERFTARLSGILERVRTTKAVCICQASQQRKALYSAGTAVDTCDGVNSAIQVGNPHVAVLIGADTSDFGPSRHNNLVEIW